MSEFKPFEDRIRALLAAMSPAGRRRMAGDMAKRLRQSQQKRIKSQKAPDGSAYEQRKPQPVRGKKGRVKREMFAKLRGGKYLKASGTDTDAVVEFTGRVQRIARVHQLGLEDRPAPGSAAVQYPTRELLGFSPDDQAIVERVIIEHLAE